MTSLIKTVFQRFSSIGSTEQTLRNIFRQRGINLVCDVGAGRGDYAGELRQSGFDGWIASFESSPECFRILQADRMYDPRWTGFNMTLAAGPARHPKQPESTGSSPLHGSVGYPNVGSLTEMIKTLERYVPHPSICLKLNSDESNIRVLEGALPLLNNIRALQIGSKGCGETIRYLRAKGFETTCHIPAASAAIDPISAFACLTVQARHIAARIAIPPQVELMNQVAPVALARSS
jgi:hypothetical protein